MKRLMLLMLLMLLVPALAFGQSEQVTGKATPPEAYQKVVEAVHYLSQTGSSGLKEFENPSGRFVWKDSYVWVTECEKNYCLPGPKSAEIGLNIAQAKCHQTGKLYILGLCDEAVENPNGAWVEYWVLKPGLDKNQRRVSFMMQVPNTPYQLVADVWDDSTSMEELNKISNRK